MARKNYFAVVNKEKGNLITIGGHLPIYWCKRVAKEIASQFKGCVVLPVNADDLHKLILSKPNKKTI
jgi:hypothetical protein